MRIKHGAIVGMAMAAMVMLGVIGSVPEQSPSPQVNVAEPSLAVAPPAPPSSIAAALSGDAPEAPPASAERMQLASAASPAGLMEALKTSAVSQAFPSDCTQVKYGFVGNPRLGPPKVQVSFQLNTTTQLLEPLNITQVEWYVSAPNAEPDSGNYEWVHRATQQYDPQVLPANQTFVIGSEARPFFDEPGVYAIGIRVQITDPSNPENYYSCPPESEPPFIRAGYITVQAEEQIPTATFTAEDLISNSLNMGLVPLNDWVALFSIQMKYTDIEAKRTLTQLRFDLTGGIEQEDILEFGLFADSSVTGEPDGILDREYDGRLEYVLGSQNSFVIRPGGPMLTWNRKGYPYEMPDSNGIFVDSDVSYNLNFTFNPHADGFDPVEPFAAGNPVFPLLKTNADGSVIGDGLLNWVISGDDPQRTYIVAIRLSSAWLSGMQLGVNLLRARMQPYTGRGVGAIISENPFPMDEYQVLPMPVNTDGTPKDSYSPDFYKQGDTLSSGATYLAQFDVYDLTGDSIWGYRPGTEHNLWDWPLKMYTPVAEHSRPRWDISDTFVDALSAEWLDLRHVMSVDSWVPVLGINMHGSCTDQIEEINLILTDIGADPYGPPGNGGFDPNYALEHFTTESSGSTDFAVQTDYSFNGAWMYYDTGTGDPCPTTSPPNNCPGDGIFTSPSAADPSGASFGINFTDYPMLPEEAEDQGAITQGMMKWEYIPFPPGGGDPWWKIRMRFSGGRRRHPGDLCTGYFEATPDYFPSNVPGTAYAQPDYFVVLHTDSGFKDLSGRQDGNGAIFGGDFRAFIEPRHWNPKDDGHWDGGLLTTNMNVNRIIPYWQDTYWIDPAYITDEEDEALKPRAIMPWWTERSHTQDTVKPQRTGFEVHDLVLAYGTNSDYGRETYITPAQVPPHPSGVMGIPLVAEPYGMANVLSHLSLWMDAPYIRDIPKIGVFTARFLIGMDPPAEEGPWDGDRWYNPGIFYDLSGGIYWGGTQIPNADEMTGVQFAFETVPFEPSDVQERYFVLPTAPRSAMYPQPLTQPMPPDYFTWPQQARLGMGLESIVYADAGSLADNVDYFGESSRGNANAVETWNGPEATYRNDIYYCELLDGNFAGRDLSGAWLIDRSGGRFKIHSNNGNVLRLVNGQAAYADRTMLNGDPLRLDHYPYGVKGGRENAVSRGAWVVAQYAMPRDRYPQLGDWGAGHSRILRQHVEYQSQPTAMLGINMAGTDDPVVNRESPVEMNSITVAFWGPEFDPSDLAKLDSDTGYLYSSGVLLYEDSSADGVFDGPALFDFSATPYFYDRIVPVEPTSLEWPLYPEPIDLDGDNVPDDMSGDGIITDGTVDLAAAGRPALTAAQLAGWDGLSDLAWVLTLRPQQPWRVPQSDVRSGDPHPAAPAYSKSGMKAPEGIFPGAVPKQDSWNWPDFWKKTPTLLDLVAPDDLAKSAGPIFSKSLPSGGHLGDDLYVVIRTSETISAFEQFRCVVPARLPDRAPVASTYAGVSFTGGLTSRGACIKTNPDEGAVQDFYGHDMLEVSVPARIVDLTEDLKPTTETPDGPVTLPTAVPVILPGGPPTSVLGIDVSSNRLENRIAYGSGEQSQATTNSFTPRASDITTDAGSIYYGAQGWTQETPGLWLIGFSQTDKEQDKRVEAYEITGVQGDTLQLLAGAPRNGSPWVVVKDPTFLEQVIVEFYDNSNHAALRNFNPMSDFYPVNQEDPANDQISGVSIYRDNDWNPKNRNGVFDPPVLNDDGEIEYIDLPVRLDDPPVWIGPNGEDKLYKLKFTFSSPGTDDSTGRDSGIGGTPYISQPRLRQWIPQCFGTCPSDTSYGPDFFVVVRPSRDMTVGDTFQAAIVSWGPDTPTEPDPDNFSDVYPGAGDVQDDMASLFTEFPWGSRGLGFITYFKQSIGASDPPPKYGAVYRHWVIDDVLRKPVPKTVFDWTQVGTQYVSFDPPYQRVWIRSNPAVSGRTQSVRSLPRPEVDFVADRHRQVTGGDVKFTLQATGSIVSLLWDFGDGETSVDRNPVHTYAHTGKYTVSVTVTDKYAINVTETKRDFIEIVAAPFVDFVAAPTDGTITPDFITGQDPGLDVTFTDLSVGTDKLRPQSWFWTFGDKLPAPEATQQSPKHRYLKEGFYTVTLEVKFLDTGSSETRTACYQIVNYITVRPCVGCPSTTEGETEGTGEGGGEDAPAADFKVTTAIKDKEGLVPLTDWVPLFNFTMGYAEDNPAERELRSLTYRVRPDQRDPKDLNYANLSGPEATDLLEFGLFIEYAVDDEKYDRKLDPLYDELLYTWDNYGSPLGRLISQSQFSGLTYQLDFIGDGTADDPEFPLYAGLNVDDGMEGYSYIVAVRTSATWRSQTTMGCDVLGAEMILPTTGVFPVDNEGKPVDNYEPNFFDGDVLEPDESYSASFTVWDITGKAAGEKDVGFFDAWNTPAFLYTPLAEHTRPRWSKLDQLLDFMPGELISARELVSLDTWVDVIGINAHSTQSVHADTYDPLVEPRTWILDAAQLTEVNLILTDIGADPYGPPGNGGFNPQEGLDPVTTSLGVSSLSGETAALKDVTFNGAWVWHDTNNNGLFDPPTPNAEGGVTFAGDYPMFPDTIMDYDLSSGSLPPVETLNWEYIPLPPGGGDPWWKLTMHFWDGRRRVVKGSTEEDDVSGFLETVPDNVTDSPKVYSGSEYTPDYFVVIRTDSGYKDISMAVPDETGITMGADFRAFIEPRRLDSKGLEAGGIYLDSMIPALGSTDGSYGDPWQEDPRWLNVEPWWPQRTVNAKSTKPVRVGLDVHDLVLTYMSDSDYRQQTDLFFGDGSFSDYSCLGYIYDSTGAPTDFDAWMDPFGLVRSQFLNGHTVGVTRWRMFSGTELTLTFGDITMNPIRIAYDYSGTRGQFAYETVPFEHELLNGMDGRSAAYPNPLDQPVIPEFATWSRALEPTGYPRASQWAPENARARLLTQKTDNSSAHTAMLGINLVGTNDPVVLDGQERPSVAQITVAFWGPDFSPDSLLALDSEGLSYNSGVLLWQDADKDGAFTESKALESYTDLPFPSNLFDEVVPVHDLKWGGSAEPIDLDGDGAPDDMNGDGVVDQRDYAWVLTFHPKVQWELPQSDRSDNSYVKTWTSCGSLNFSGKKFNDDGTLAPGVCKILPKAADAAKQAEGETTTDTGTDTAQETDVNPGDDLFITIRTSDKVKRFQGFRAVIPATLPGRAESQRKAGIQFLPQVNTSASSFMKLNAEEDPVQDFYGHDMLEMNVPVKLHDLTNQQQAITPGGAAVPLLGLDLSTNRDDGTLVAGTNGVGSAKAFTVPGAAWTANAFAGDWLVDEGYETYEITANAANQLTLLSGKPRDGRWRIVRDPSFLEQVIIELYNEGEDADFNPVVDFLPLDIDQEMSGVALYRDNDMDPNNRNGLFDPNIDIPIPLDAAPCYIGQTGEVTQVKFVFSSPGTDDIPVPRDQQARNRQWIPDTFGDRSSNPFYGPDFFLVVRASENMKENDNFRVGLVSWGPNTPTEPDPDTWAALSGEERNEFSKFEEFPWGVRGLGFVTFFKNPKVNYYMDGYKAGQKADNSGVNWIRSHTSKKRRTGVATAHPKPVSPTTVVIESASVTELPSQTLPGQSVSLVIRGQHFGANPVVLLTGYDVQILQATDDTISIAVSTVAGSVPQEPLVLIVRNTVTNEEASRSNLLRLKSGTTDVQPSISGVDPSQGDQNAFPVRVIGQNFSARENLEVLFGRTLMPVISVSADGKNIQVGFPMGGLPVTGDLDVTVRNKDKSTETVLVDGFNYVNNPVRPKAGFGCGAGSQADSASGGMSDALVLLLTAAALCWAVRRGVKKGLSVQ